MMHSKSDLANQIGARLADTVGIKLRTEVLFLRPDQIDPDPEQPRQEFDHEGLARLAESLRKFSQLQPVLVRKAGSRYILVSGERRWRAAKIAGMTTIQALLCKGGDVLSIQLVENLLREDLKPIEQARAYKAIMEREGLSVRELTRHLSIEHSGISKSLRLLKLPEEIQKQVDSGEIPPTTAYEISKQPNEKQGPLAKAAAEGRLKGDDLRRPKPAPAPAPEPAPRRPAAAPVLTLGAPRDDSWVFAAGRGEVVISGFRDNADALKLLEKAAAAFRARKKSLVGGVGRR
jgi:ParB family chromosome partitioning protein